MKPVFGEVKIDLGNWGALTAHGVGAQDLMRQIKADIKYLKLSVNDQPFTGSYMAVMLKKSLKWLNAKDSEML